LRDGLLKEYCQKYLERFKVPNEIIIMDKIPKSSTGKILRAELVRRVVRCTKYDGLEI